MTCDDQDARKFDELDRLLNDPDVPLQPGLIWHLLHEVSRQRPGEERLVVDDTRGGSVVGLLPVEDPYPLGGHQKLAFAPVMPHGQGR